MHIENEVLENSLEVIPSVSCDYNFLLLKRFYIENYNVIL